MRMRDDLVGYRAEMGGHACNRSRAPCSNDYQVRRGIVSGFQDDFGGCPHLDDDFWFGSEIITVGNQFAQTYFGHLRI